MQIEVLKSKIHRVKVTGADLDYIGSITIDEALLEAAGMIEGEKVSIVNVNNGERLDHQRETPFGGYSAQWACRSQSATRRYNNYHFVCPNGF